MKPVAIVPAAGIGSRLRPHTYTVPKALLHVAGKPILGHILDGLREQGIERFVVVVGYMGDRVREYLARTYRSGIEVVDQSERLGLGHAVWMAAPQVRSGPALIILGDTIVEPEWSDFMGGDQAVIGVREVDDPRRYGVVELDGERVIRLVEKPERPPTNLAIVGIYYIPESARLFAALQALIASGQQTRREFQLTDALQAMLAAGEPMRISRIEGWYDCGTTETLLETNRYLLQRVAPIDPRPGVTLVPPVLIAPDATVENAVIGPNVSIAERAVVRDAVIRESIINIGAQVEGLLLEQSVIGEEALVRGALQHLNVGDHSEIDFRGGRQEC